MKYNFKEIGKIISKERKAAGFKSQDALIEYLSQEYGYHLSRNTLSKIEQGKTSHYDCELLYILCEIFDCEIGYLLGEYECKTGRNTDIVQETGLSDCAVNKIREMLFENKATGFTDILSLLIEHSSFANFLSLLANNSTGVCDVISLGGTSLVPDRKAIINSELKDVTIEIASNIRKQYTPNDAAIAYKLLYGLYREEKISIEQLQETEKEFDKGNFEYSPKDVHLKK